MGPESQMLYLTQSTTQPFRAQAMLPPVNRPDIPRSHLLAFSHPTHTLAAGSPSTTSGIEGQRLPSNLGMSRIKAPRESNVAWAEQNVTHNACTCTRPRYSCQIDPCPQNHHRLGDLRP